MMTESEIAKHFIEYFADEDVYQEVPISGGIVDIVVKRTPVVIAVEVKKNLNMDVIEQAIRNTKYFNYSYIAIPIKRSNIHKVHTLVCDHFGLGILAYSPDGYRSYYNSENKRYTINTVSEIVTPKLNRNVKVPELHDWMKRSVAGSQNNRLTAFGVFVEDLKEQLSRVRNGLTVQELFDKTIRYYGSMKSFKSNVYQWVRRGVIKDVEYKDGKYYLVKNTKAQ